MAQALMQNAPLSIGLNASPMQYYNGGIPTIDNIFFWPFD